MQGDRNKGNQECNKITTTNNKTRNYKEQRIKTKHNRGIVMKAEVNTKH